jgi:putative DNA modification/repair radical SAM protein
MDRLKKLSILADAAKYDASCASSGASGRRSSPDGGLGSTTGMGICHSYAPDGRCISLLKILLTNFCLYDCRYCVNRRSSDVPRARFSVAEVVDLTLEFYRRNYIEGLFLSSGVIRSPDYTMEQLIAVARSLRVTHDFRGYIHLKTIPDADPLLVEEAGRHADRLSVNVELPSEAALERLAPEKSIGPIKIAMADIRRHREEARAPRAPRFAPAGQSTQMIVGADDSNDRVVLGTADVLYRSYRLRRVYYSAYSPIQAASPLLPGAAPPLVREHRLYQADWLLRHYGYTVDELLPTAGTGTLDLRIDPKLAYALEHPAQFPVDVNVAPREALLRVPGIGTRNVERVLALRRRQPVRYLDLRALGCDMSKAADFVVTPDHRPPPRTNVAERMRARRAAPTQATLW